MLLFMLFTAVCSLLIVTIGAAFISLVAMIRRLADYDVPKAKDYFLAFREKFRCGLPYSVALILIVVTLSFNYSKYPVLIIAGIMGIIIFTFTMYYPVVACMDNKINSIFRKSVAYVSAHLLQTFMMVSIFYLLCGLVILISEFLILLVYPICYYMICRIVLANNKEIEQEEEIIKNLGGKEE